MARACSEQQPLSASAKTCNLSVVRARLMSQWKKARIQGRLKWTDWYQSRSAGFAIPLSEQIVRVRRSQVGIHVCTMFRSACIFCHVLKYSHKKYYWLAPLYNVHKGPLIDSKPKLSRFIETQRLEAKVQEVFSNWWGVGQGSLQLVVLGVIRPFSCSNFLTLVRLEQKKVRNGLER